MNRPATQAGLPQQQQHTTEAGRHDTPAVLSAQEARKLLSLPGVTSFRQGAVLIVVDAQGKQYIVQDLNTQASPPQASPDDADGTDGTDSTDDTAQRAGQETPEEAPADLQVPAASAEVASATLAEVHMAQAPADSTQPEAKSDDETCKDDDDKKDANGDDKDDDNACPVVRDSGSGWGLGLAGVGLAAAMGGGGGSGGGSGGGTPGDTTPPTPPSAPDLAAEDDSGTSDTDDITVYTTGLNFSGTAEAGATVQLFVDLDEDGVMDEGEELGTGVATGGTYSIDTSLALGSHKVRAIATDLAGNVSEASGTTVVTVIPPALGFVINGQSAGERIGYAVSSAGDVNGDGLADLIVGAHLSAPSAGTNAGRSYVVFGKADGTAIDLSLIASGTGGFVINGQAAGDYSGTSVSSAGDVNGDGLADLIVGADSSDPAAGSSAGRSYVVFGKADGTAVELSAIAENETGGFVINGQSQDDFSGWSVSSAGDVNGDGLADLIVGAYKSDPAAGNEAGRSYVVFGKADGTAIDLSQIASGTGGFVINGQAQDDFSGWSVSSAGDVNGDGLADLIVGAPYSAPAAGYEDGRSYVVFGKADGTAINLSQIASGTGGFVINGQSAGDYSGWSVSSAGDVNGDGLADLMVGAFYSDPAAGTDAGRSYVVFGQTGGTAVELSAIAENETGGFVINGQSAGDWSGSSVSSAGDVNGDGLADLIVGAYTSDPAAGSNAGRSYVVFGKTDGTAINLSQIASGTGGFVINGQSAGDISGISASSAGDVNGDGLADLIVGASLGDPSAGTNAGRSYVIFGKTGFDAVNLGDVALGGDAALPFDFAGTSGADTWSGTTASETALGGAGNDTLTGNGGADVLYGGAGNDTLVLNADNIAHLVSPGPTSGRLARVDGGGGIDTLAVAGTGVTLDLTQIANQAAGDPETGSRIASIEKINLSGSGNNTLNLSVGDVLDMAGMNQFNTENGWSNVTGTALGTQVQRHQLVIDGDADDQLTSPDAAGTWNFVGTVSDGEGNTYNVFNATNSATSAQLLVNTNITQTLDTLVLPPNPPSAPDLAAEDDSGASNTDNITVYTTGLSFSGTAEAGATVSLFVDVNNNGVMNMGELLGTGVATGGTYSIDTSLALGSHKVRAIATDLAGNLSEASDTTVVTVVSTPPKLGFVINGEAAGDNSGHSVFSAGDVNGDGLADLIVGAPYAEGSAGRSYVVFGKADGTAVELSDIAVGGTAGFVINGQSANDYSGISVASAGDVNGDGLADLIVGAPYAAGYAGRSYVIFGQTGGTPVELSAIAAGGTEGFVINGQSAMDLSGISVASAGDVNGDGLADLIVGASWAGGFAGRSYVVFGKADGAAVELSTIAAGSTGGFVINGQSAGDFSGNSVSAAGDVNGDGLADLIVGALGVAAAAGRSYVVFGKTGGTAVDLSAIEASTSGFVINGQSVGDESGTSVSSAGDVNGDGLADLIVGAYASDPVTGGTSAGRSYVVFGKTGGTTVELSAIAAGGTAGFVINGQSADDNSGYSVSSAGDVNGDGLADLIVGAPLAGGYAGRSYVVFGKTGGTAVELSAIEAGTGGGFVINGQSANDYSGESVSAAGDVNGDGLADLIVGAYASDPATDRQDAGRSYVIFGKTGFDAVNLGDVAAGGDAALVVNDTWNGTTASETALGGAGDDTLTGNGGADVLYGGAGNDTLVLNADNIAHLSQGLTDGRLARVDGGGGIDTLTVAGTGVTLDLTQIANQAAGDPQTGSRIASIEKINLSGSGNNTLTLLVGDVLDMAGMNQFNDGNGWTGLGASVQRHQLVIDGDAGDSVTSSGWTDTGGTVTNGGQTYAVYNSTAASTLAQLLVDVDITRTAVVM